VADKESAGRRIGAPEAKNRAVLLDAAEQLMLEEGYASVTSRRLAERAGLKPQLVHYYFRTMEDLFLEVFRRGAEKGLKKQVRALESPQPLWALWRLGTDPAASRITMEFAALANHRKSMRSEIAHYAERFREEQWRTLAKALARYDADADAMPPIVWSVLFTSLSTVLVMEKELGMSLGHAETVEVVERYLRRLEGEPPPIQEWVPGPAHGPTRCVDDDPPRP
jgi:AcrR family transcriptional regulator